MIFDFEHPDIPFDYWEQHAAECEQGGYVFGDDPTGEPNEVDDRHVIILWPDA